MRAVAMKNVSGLRTVSWVNGKVVMIDQRALPGRLRYLRCADYRQVATAIRGMVVRGAPAIGVAAAMGLALAARKSKAKTNGELILQLENAAEVLRKTRPTAVNLFWAVDRVLRKARETKGDLRSVQEVVVQEAVRMADEDIQANMTIGRIGSELIRAGDKILTHCNAGALATVGYGTALGVIRAAKEKGKKISVLVTETRPRLQGAKLTTYELLKEGIESRVITDSMVGHVMANKLVDKVITGADRVLAQTGHVINKIGTLTIALTAAHYNIPFYVAAPLSSIDFTKLPSDVKIEERDQREVHFVGRSRITPANVQALNPAFDITDPSLVTGIITEKGILKPDELMSLLSSS